MAGSHQRLLLVGLSFGSSTTLRNPERAPAPSGSRLLGSRSHTTRVVPLSSSSLPRDSRMPRSLNSERRRFRLICPKNGAWKSKDPEAPMVIKQKNRLRRYPQQHAVLFLVLAPPRSPRRTSWNPRGTLVEPSWNLTQGRLGPPRSLSGLRPQSLQDLQILDSEPRFFGFLLLSLGE